MSEERVSVIVPVYGAEKVLSRCVESIMAQTYSALEIILVDDGSRDAGGRMCDEYAGKDSRIKVIHKENGGLVSAWTEGVKASRGRYICFVDSDDWVEPGMIGGMVEEAAGREDEVVCCNFVIDRNGTSTPKAHALAPGEYVGERLFHDVKRQLLGHEERTVSMSRCMKLFSRKLIVDNLGYADASLRMGEDVSIVLPALLDSGRVVVMEGAYDYHYVYYPESMVHKYDPGMYEDVRRLYADIRRIAEEKREVPGGRLDNGPDQARGEYLFLLMLVLKNEARRRGKGRGKRIKEICEREGTPALLSASPVEAKRGSNRLMLAVMRHPGRLTAWLLCAAVGLYDRRERG